jgi:predicted DNA-binding transcriptional regulator AlpA
MTSENTDFRERFSVMAPEALITRKELAELLCTSIGAISQMIYKNELPQTAFATKRRTVWQVQVIRSWLNNQSNQVHETEMSSHNNGRRLGRPRKGSDH